MKRKYVIEVEESPYKNLNGETLWKIQGLNACMVSSDLDKLVEYVEYVEPVTHKFEVGDVCKIASSDPELIISRITPDCVSYMWDDGSYGTIRRSIFEHQATFIRHSNYFEMFLAGGLK